MTTTAATPSPTDPWASIVGQARAVEALRRAAERPVHAYLLVGPRGSGIEEGARALAAFADAPLLRSIAPRAGTVRPLVRALLAVAALEDAGLEITAVSSTEHWQAYGMFVDACTQGKLRHRGTPELTLAVRGAKERAIGDGAGACAPRVCHRLAQHAAQA